MIRASIVRSKIDVDALTREAASPACGATAVFLGTVREENEGRSVKGIEYTAYDAMAEREMMLVLEEARARYAIESGIIEHRIGELAVGDISIAVVVTHPHRGPAIDALHFVIDETKARATIWKLEQYADGTREWVGAGTGQPK
jgi:molybdopterin synthase catalytic subunit